jgi:5'-nucleotidase
MPNHLPVTPSPVDAPAPPPRPNRVFVNRNLRMDCIRAVGFDMDYTLARYHKERVEALAYRLTLEKLVRSGYPAAIADFVYDPRFVIRGLTVDKQLGNILKLDRHNHPSRVYHGRRKLSQQQRRTLYRREMIRFVPPRFSLVDTLFSLPEVCVYADLIAYFEATSDVVPDYARIFDETRQAIDATHRDDSLKSVIRADFDAYVEPDPLLPHTLRKLRSSGKKIFLLTNSAWDYTHAVMQYILPEGDGPAGHWTDYFDTVIVSSQKPDFFVGASPFTDIKDPQGAVSAAVGVPDPGQIGAPCEHCAGSSTQLLAGGNLRAFEERLGVAGEEILYVGDHIYGDILRSKKTSLWRTAFVVEELEDEIEATQQRNAEVARLDALERQRQDLDNQLNTQRQHLATLDRQQPAEPWVPGRIAEVAAQRVRTRQALDDVVSQMRRLEAVVADTFNPTWGMVFKEDRENSRFGDQVGDYACVYTSRVTNFSNYSSYQYFRSPRDLLPHERDTF